MSATLEYIGSTLPHTESIQVGKEQQVINVSTAKQVIQVSTAVGVYLLENEASLWKAAEGWVPPPVEPVPEGNELPFGTVKAGETKKLDCAVPGLLGVAKLEGNATFEIIHKPTAGSIEVSLKWEVTVDGAVPTFTAEGGTTISWINSGSEPAWNTTAGASNVAFFIVRKASSNEIIGLA